MGGNFWLLFGAKNQQYSVAINMTAVTTRRDSTQAKGEERETRVTDFLDDKLQTYTDLENIDVLLRNVNDQQTLLRKQVGCSAVLNLLKVDHDSYVKQKYISEKQRPPLMCIMQISYNILRNSRINKPTSIGVLRLSPNPKQVTMRFTDSIPTWKNLDGWT